MTNPEDKSDAGRPGLVPCTIVCTGCGNRGGPGVDYFGPPDPAMERVTVPLLDGHFAWKLELEDIEAFRKRKCRFCGESLEVKAILPDQMTPEARAKWKRGGRG